MKKIISFSLWGNKKKYVLGALENIKLKDQLFPDWICRFYVHISTQYQMPKEFQLLQNFSEVIIKEETPEIKHMDMPGMFWRFEVLNDKDVERCIVRDTDGRLTQRDRNCVKDWEKSGKQFHIIRDHPMHNTRIMGGMWGATYEFINRINYDSLIEQFDQLSYNNMYATDQEFLARMIYPLIKDNVCVHDDFWRFKDEIDVRKIPHLRIGNNEYIGMPYEI